MRHPARFDISVPRFVLLSVFDDVIISFRWISAPLLPLLSSISQSEKTCSACVRPPLHKLGPLPLFVANNIQLCKPPSLHTTNGLYSPELLLNFHQINFSSADEDLIVRVYVEVCWE